MQGSERTWKRHGASTLDTKQEECLEGNKSLKSFMGRECQGLLMWCKIKCSAMEYYNSVCRHDGVFLGTFSEIHLTACFLVIKTLYIPFGNEQFVRQLPIAVRASGKTHAMQLMTSRWGCRRAAGLSRRCCSAIPTPATAVTYFLGLARTTQRHTRGVS